MENNEENMDVDIGDSRFNVSRIVLFAMLPMFLSFRSHS